MNMEDRTTNLQSGHFSTTSPLLDKLPLELRRMNYQYSVHICRLPNPKYFSEDAPCTTWKDLPSSLLYVNRQIRLELCDVLAKSAFPIRITTSGAHFDAMALTGFIAQRHRKSYSGLTCLVLDIWPPHPDRTVEMYYIWKHLENIRNELKAASPMPKLAIRFLDFPGIAT